MLHIYTVGLLQLVTPPLLVAVLIADKNHISVCTKQLLNIDYDFAFDFIVY
jgi:hypothetical protein